MPQKNSQETLETLHKSQEEAQEHRKELFEQNAMLHADQAPDETEEDDIAAFEELAAASKSMFDDSIKRAEDMERIARNTTYGDAAEASGAQPFPLSGFAGMFHSNLSQLMELHLQMMNLFVENCTKMISITMIPEKERA